MSFDIGISGINSLGTYGLGGTGMYGSYTDPMMMGAYSPYGMGMGMNMMGMYPTYMKQMMEAQQDIEKMQLNHASDIHKIKLEHNTEEYKAHDRNIFEKAMVDVGVNGGIAKLAEKIKEGDQDGICEEFDKLKQTVYTKYRDYFNANKDNMNVNESVTNFVEVLYSKIRTAQTGHEVSLRNDIEKYGESSFEHGFWKNLHGKDYHQKYTEETLNHIYGTNIDNKEGKERMAKVGAKAESIAEYVASPFVGYAAGVGAATTIAGLGKLFLPLPKAASSKFNFAAFKSFGKVAGTVGAIAALVGDIWWQNSRA